MIPINEMTEVMKTCDLVEKQKLQVHQWVRIKSGIHKDDLGLIELVDGNRRALVRLIPRIPEEFYADKDKTINHLRAMNKKQSEYIRIPQKLFDPVRVKDECMREIYRPMDKYFYFWRRMMFRNGFLYQEFAASRLITENVSPSLQEVKMFQLEGMTIGTGLYDDYDQDEWDVLDNATVAKTIKDDPELNIKVQDRVRIMHGQFKNIVGVVDYIQDGVATLHAEDSKCMQISVKAHQVKKQFKIGEQVRII